MSSVLIFLLNLMQAKLCFFNKELILESQCWFILALERFELETLDL